ncbi:FAST kinase domain-containing protein 5, mitochondrial [Petromyzon marinus]|uniref:FAST kinase domain-containing protein 5, mitochondrial n=1 Tax=Petromyzon marinus TaxID=7757 RepID=UPI003F72F27E
MASLGSRQLLLTLAVATRRRMPPSSVIRVWASTVTSGRNIDREVGIDGLGGPSLYSCAKHRLHSKAAPPCNSRTLRNSATRVPIVVPRNCSISLSRSYSLSSRSATSELDAVQQVLSASDHVWREEMDEADCYDPQVDPRRFQRMSDDYAELCCCAEDVGSTPVSLDEAQAVLAELLCRREHAHAHELLVCLQAVGGVEAWYRRTLHRDSRFKVLLGLVSSKVGNMNGRELVSTLTVLCRTGLSPTHPLYAKCEAELCRRADDMSLEQLLLVADVWRLIGYRAPRFLELLFARAMRDWAGLSRPCTVQLLYIVGENRGAPDGLVSKLEQLVVRHVSEMTAEEVGASCLAFFKSRHKVLAQTMQQIGDKVTTDMRSISNFGLIGVLKLFRLTHFDHVPFLRRLCTVVPTRLPDLGVQGVMHVALACAALHYLDEPLMRALAAQVKKRSSFGRSKDLAKLLWAFGSLACELPGATEDMYAALVQLLRERSAQFERYPRHMVTALLALAFTGRFPQDLLNEVLSPRYSNLLEQRTKEEMRADLYTLDASVGLECPGYAGNRLDRVTRQEMWHMMQNKLTMAALTRPEVSKALEALAVVLGGSQLAQAHAVLPHSRSYDIEVHFDERGRPVPFVAKDVDGEHLMAIAGNQHEPPQRFETQPKEVEIADELISKLFRGRSAGASRGDPNVRSQKSPLVESLTRAAGRVPLTASLVQALTNRELPESGRSPDSVCVNERATSQYHQQQGPVRKVAMQVTNHNNYLYRMQRHTGLQAMKRRQLLLSGYTVVEIPYWDWMPMLNEPLKNRVAYIERKLNFCRVE